jgi:hypothetical protein
MSPYLGVLDRVLRALNKAFSAPRIWTVEAGYLARVVRDLSQIRTSLVGTLTRRG